MITASSSDTDRFRTSEVGDTAGGYRIEVDTATTVTRVVAWGFWDVAVASKFGTDVLGACARTPAAAELVLDLSELKPMRDEGQHGLAQIVAAVPSLGIGRVTVMTASQLTKLQALRIVKENDRSGQVRFVEGGAAWNR